MHEFKKALAKHAAAKTIYWHGADLSHAKPWCILPLLRFYTPNHEEIVTLSIFKPQAYSCADCSLTPLSWVSFERNENKEPCGMLSFFEAISADRKTLAIEGDIKKWLRDRPYSSGEKFSVYSVGELQAFLKNIGDKYDLSFVWDPDIYIPQSDYIETALRPDNQEHYCNLIDFLKLQPANTIIPWSDDGMYFSKPWGEGWLDVRLPTSDLEPGPAWTIQGEPECPADLDYIKYSTHIYLPYDASLTPAGKTTLQMAWNGGKIELPYKKCPSRVWTPAAINQALGEWTKIHVQRDDLVFHWAAAAPKSNTFAIIESYFKKKENTYLDHGQLLPISEKKWWNKENICQVEDAIIDWNKFN